MKWKFWRYETGYLGIIEISGFKGFRNRIRRFVLKIVGFGLMSK